MSVRIQTFTKEDAEEIINNYNNVNYRKLKQHVVDMYAKEMKEGRWAQNGDSIKFDWNGQLRDGQHRLFALIKSGIPQTFVVVENLDPACEATMDIGHKRSIEDYLKRQEESYQKGCTAVVKLAMNFMKHNKQVGQSIGNGTPSNMSIIDEYTEHSANYTEATAYGKKVSLESKKVLKPSHVGAIFYYLVNIEGISKDYVKGFFDRIVTSSRNDKSIFGKTYDILLDKDSKLGRSGTAIVGTYIRCWNAMVHKCTSRLQEYSDWFENPNEELFAKNEASVEVPMMVEV